MPSAIVSPPPGEGNPRQHPLREAGWGGEGASLQESSAGDWMRQGCAEIEPEATSGSRFLCE